MPGIEPAKSSTEPRIAHVSIRNFKSIKSLELDLPDFAVFVGPNGAGKTNLIQALALLGDIVDTGSSDPARDAGWADIIRREKKPARSGLALGASVRVPGRWLRRRAMISPRGREGASTPDVVVDVSVTLTGRKDNPRVEIGKEKLILRLELDSRPLLTVSSEGGLPPSVESDADPVLDELFGTPKGQSTAELLRDLFGPNRIELLLGGGTPFDDERRFLRLVGPSRGYRLPWAQAVTRATSVQRFRLDATSLRADSSAELRGRFNLDATGIGLAAAVARLRGFDDKPTRAFGPILHALQGVYGRIEDIRPIRIAAGRLSLQFRERGISDPIDQTGVSDGVLHALALLIALHTGDSGVLAIEEPENAIHPWSVRALMDYAQGVGRQLLLTTHSETVVNAIRDPRALFIVEQGDDGTHVVPAKSRESALDSILVESGQQLGDIWMDGSLGGVPGSEP